MSRVSKNIIGETFGKLLVVSAGIKSTKKNKSYIVKCISCGTESEKLDGNITRSEKNKSKGCACEGVFRLNRKTPPNSWKHPAYKTWEGMMKRCYSESHVAYKRYGGRGIFVCDEWHDIDKFFAWIKSTNWHNGGLQIDRINNDKEYSPENCRVVNCIENMSNKSTNRFINVDGEKLTIAEASRKYGVNKTTIKERLNRGLSDIDSVRKVIK